KIDTATIIAGRERRAGTPAQARNFLDAMRGLFRWAKDAQHVRTDPTAGVKNPKRKKGPGFKMWTEEEMVAYERRWPIGTRQRVCRDRHMACARSLRRARLRMGQRSPSWRRSSAGKAVPWRRCTRGQQIVAALR